MKQNHGIVGRTKRNFKATTDSKHDYPVADNLLERQFTCTQPNQRWAVEFTYIPTQEGWLYLAVVIDLFMEIILKQRDRQRMK